VARAWHGAPVTRTGLRLLLGFLCGLSWGHVLNDADGEEYDSDRSRLDSPIAEIFQSRCDELGREFLRELLPLASPDSSLNRLTPTYSSATMNTSATISTQLVSHSRALPVQRGYGASISTILPSFLRCSTFTFPSRSRNSASFTASSSVIGLSATESSDFVTCASVMREDTGNECTTTSTAVV